MQLNQMGHEIMAVDINEERVNKVLPFVTNAQIGDSTDAQFLESLGIGNFDICFVTIGDSFQNSLETTSLLKELGAKLVISRAERDVQENGEEEGPDDGHDDPLAEKKFRIDEINSPERRDHHGHSGIVQPPRH